MTGTTEGGGRIGPIARATPPPPKREERFASPLSVGWMSCCPHPPTTTTRHTFYLTHFTAEGGAPEEPGRAGFNPAGVQPGGSGFREGGRAGFNPAGRGGSTWRPHAYSTASEKIAAEMIQSLSKMPFSFTNNLFCCTTPNHVALVGEKKTSEARGERGEEQRIMRPAPSLSIAEYVKRGAGVGVALRKPEEKKRNLTEPSLFTFGEEVAWGPWGLRGFSLTARTEEEWKLIHWRC